MKTVAGPCKDRVKRAENRVFALVHRNFLGYVACMTKRMFALAVLLVAACLLEAQLPGSSVVPMRGHEHPASRPARIKRFDEISVLTKSGGRCDHAAVELSTKGIKTTECHESDIDLAWKDVESVCYLFSFHGTMVLRTAGGEERRLSTTTPAAMKSIRDAVRSRSPKTRETTGCK